MDQLLAYLLHVQHVQQVISVLKESQHLLFVEQDLIQLQEQKIVVLQYVSSVQPVLTVL